MPQLTKTEENITCQNLSNDALEQAICDLEMHRDSNFHVMEQKNVLFLIDTLRALVQQQPDAPVNLADGINDCKFETPIPTEIDLEGLKREVLSAYPGHDICMVCGAIDFTVNHLAAKYDFVRKV